MEREIYKYEEVIISSLGGRGEASGGPVASSDSTVRKEVSPTRELDL